MNLSEASLAFLALAFSPGGIARAASTELLATQPGIVKSEPIYTQADVEAIQILVDWIKHPGCSPADCARRLRAL